MKINLLFPILLFSINCISLERGLQSQLYYSSQNVAVYKLDKVQKKFLCLLQEL
ncbi:MAG: hypothetical protein IPO06_02230 [Leptospiraceae bacterium]|nr:hypothetical protein [Leptospiraceae bacterium]